MGGRCDGRLRSDISKADISRDSSVAIVMYRQLNRTCNVVVGL